MKKLTPKNFVFLLLLAAIFPLFILSCKSVLAGSNTGGRIGGGVSSDILPNFADLIFKDVGVSKATQEELKMAREDFVRGYQHTEYFVSQAFRRNDPNIAKIAKLKERLAEEEKFISVGDMNETQKLELARQMAEKRLKPEKWKFLSKEEREKVITFERQKVDIIYSPRSIELAKKSADFIRGDIEELQVEDQRPKRIMKVMAVSPEVVAYVYKKLADRRGFLLQYPDLKKNDTLDEFKFYNTLAEQARALASQKERVTRQSLQIAKEEASAELAKSQSVINLFNSIFIGGHIYNYNNKPSPFGEQGISHYTDAWVSQRLGEVVDLIYGVSKNKMCALMNTTAILEAQAAKMAIGMISGEFLLGGREMRDHLENPSQQAILNAERKVSDAKVAMLHGSSPGARGAGFAEWRRWSVYLDLLRISMDCDKIVRQVLLNNIRSEESAQQIYNEKVKNLLGGMVRVQSEAYFNF